MDLYELARGPLAWAALLIFLLGSLYRMISLYIGISKEKVVYPYMNAKYGLRSILHWLTPFGSKNMKMRPVMTVVSFIFHLCLILVPVFLLGHIVLWYESWKIQWVSLSAGLADGMSFIVVICCIFFLIRRIITPEVRHVTDASDILLLAIIALPFLTGIMAYHQWGPYKSILTIHILASEIMLVAIPFTKLSHMLLFFFTRAYMGSEFGSVRNSQDW